MKLIFYFAIHLRRLLIRIINFIVEIPGFIVWLKIVRNNEVLNFKDKFNHTYILDRYDPIPLNLKRKSITDSSHVAKYILKTLQPNNTSIDIGAAYGAISVPMWHAVAPRGKVISIEADSSKLTKLKRNILANNFPTKNVYSIAISNKKEVRSFRYFPECPGWNTLGNPKYAKNYKSYTKKVLCSDLESFLKEIKIMKVDLVKIDTEGAELLVLKGMKSLLKKKFIKTVIFELNPFMLPGMDTSPEQIINFWSNLPYRLEMIKPDGETKSLPKKLSKYRVIDVVAIQEP